MTKIVHERYLSEKMKLEQTLFQEVVDGRAIYCTTRNNLADLAKPFIAKYLENGRQPKILELGCGSGNAMKKILEYTKGLSPNNLAGTSLNRLPEHQELNSLGLQVYTEIVAEFLPSAWGEMFDMVIASTVMQWTQVDLAVPEIKRVLKERGYFVGFDDRATVCRVEKTGIKCGLRSEYSEDIEKLWQRVGREGVPFVLQKQ